MAGRPELHLFLPQMRMTAGELVERAQAAEAAGFDGIALMDHLAPPLAESQPMLDAIVAASWVLAHTETLTVGHLVLCDSFREPAVLAKQVVTLDHASGGRFELGIGWGSMPSEFAVFGIGESAARTRVERLGETLVVLDRLWTGEPVDHDGEHHTLRHAQQQPVPLGEIPIVIGGAGPLTLALVANHADWWNCPMTDLDRFDELRPSIGSARASIQRMVAFVEHESERAQIAATAQRRFGGMGSPPLVGDAAEIAAELEQWADRGAERVYLWFADFAPPTTLEAFGRGVIAA